MGECGARGGYYEVTNMESGVKFELNKLSSAQLCSNVLGQACMYGVVSPPGKKEESYDMFMREKSVILSGLKERLVLSFLKI